MLPTELQRLPAWASYRVYGPDDPRGKEGHVQFYKGRVLLDVDADEMYPSVLGEYVALYDKNNRPDFIGVEEWPAVFGELEPDDEDVLSAYWLEVAYQTAKMDIQRAVGFGANISIHNGSAESKERYRQASSPAGIRAGRAAGWWTTPEGEKKLGIEARQHYKKLRGFLVA